MPTFRWPDRQENPWVLIQEGPSGTTSTSSGSGSDPRVQGLVDSDSVPNEKLGKSAKKTHRYLIVKVVVKDLAPPRESSRERPTEVPLLVVDFRRSCTSGELMIPLELVNETFSRLREVLSPYGNRAFQFTEEPDQALSFTIASPPLIHVAEAMGLRPRGDAGHVEDAMKKSKG